MNQPEFEESLEELIDTLQKSRTLKDSVAAAGAAILQALQKGNKLLTCGNGGSAADALHLSEELVGRYKLERRGLPSICLNADVTAITCIANDYGYDRLFSRQVEALGKKGDVLVGFTTSDNSENVLAAFQLAKEKDITTICLGGKDGGRTKSICHFELIVPSHTTARIQEVHTLILHQWLEAVDAFDWTTVEL